MLHARYISQRTEKLITFIENTRAKNSNNNNNNILLFYVYYILLLCSSS